MFAVVTFVLVLVWLALRSGHRTSRPVAAKPRRQSARPPGNGPLDGPVMGLALGHELARHHHAPFGDPLPHGHLGDPASVAFWAGLGSTLEDEDQAR